MFCTPLVVTKTAAAAFHDKLILFVCCASLRFHTGNLHSYSKTLAFIVSSADTVVKCWHLSSIIMANFCDDFKSTLKLGAYVSSRSSNKYRYQANRAFVIGRIKRILPKILCGILKLPSIDLLFQDSLRCRSQIIPGRSFRRKKNKTKGRTHFNNQKAAF